MFKITVILSLFVIGSVVCASSLSCQSCGAECVSSCGTRRFRSCCFNYLRRKRGPETLKLSAPNLQGTKSKFPVYVIEEPEVWGVLSNDYKPSTVDDTIDNGFQILSEA